MDDTHRRGATRRLGQPAAVVFHGACVVLLAANAIACPRFESPSDETTTHTQSSESTVSPEDCGAVPLAEGFVCIPGGPYTYGCAAGCDLLPVPVGEGEPPPHYAASREVELSSFQIMTHEVTAAAYAACLEERECAPPGCTDFFGTWPMTEADADRPITCVAADGAAAFCEWYGRTLGLEGRLPTECEWEKAARGNIDARRYPTGDAAPLCDDAVLGQLGSPPPCVGKAGPASIGSRVTDVSPWGVFDMTGNVSELTSSPVSGEGPRPSVQRGGAWHVDPFGDPASSRLDLRRVFVEQPESFPTSIVGFRCVVGVAAADAAAECPPPG